MEVLFAATGSILTVLLFAVIFCILGGVLSERMGVSGGDGCYVFAASYFIGMAVYLALFRTLALLTSSYRIAFWSLLILLGIAAAVSFYRQHRLQITVNKNGQPWPSDFGWCIVSMRCSTEAAIFSMQK